MADVDIKYKGSSISTMNASGSKTLLTGGKYCEADIVVEYVDPEKPTQTKSVSPSESQQTVTPDSGKVLSSVTVGAISSTYVGTGVTRKAAATYTPNTTGQTIAANQYLTGAQTIQGDANLVSGNIKQGVSIFGVSGSLTPGITPTGSQTITANGTYDITSKAEVVVNVQPLLKELFPPKCVYVARAKVKCTSSGTITISLNSGYAFNAGALKKSTLTIAFRNDGNQFGMPAQAALANDTPGSVGGSRGVTTANSSSAPRIDTTSSSTLGQIATLNLRSNTEFIFTIFYSDADAYTGVAPTKIPFSTLVSCTSSAGTLTITDTE